MLTRENQIIVGIGGHDATCTPGKILRTLALGSCVALIVLDRNTRCIGLVHVALPESELNPEYSKICPGQFADTAVPAILNKMRTVAGSISNANGLIVKLAGGANVADHNNKFNIGKRNVVALNKALWHYNLAPMATDVGGSFSRSVSVYRDNGRIILSSPGKTDWKL